MNRKEYIISISVIVTVLSAVIITNYFLQYIDNWWWIFIAALLGYMYIRYKISAPMQMFSRKFNMYVDYDLDVEAAEKLAEEGLENSPTQGIKALYMVYVGMAKYYVGKYREAINTFNQIDVKKINPAYHVLIFAFTAYSSYEEGDVEAFNQAIERIKSARNRVGKKYQSFADGYIEILNAIKNLDIDPEGYRDVVERHFSRNDGYISTKIIYNYRMAYYYRTINDTEQMDICLAKVIANGKQHHMAIQAKKIFTGTCKIEDYVFTDDAEEKIEDIEAVETVDEEEIKQIEDIETLDVVEDQDLETDETKDIEDKKED